MFACLITTMSGECQSVCLSKCWALSDGQCVCLRAGHSVMVSVFVCVLGTQ